VARVKLKDIKITEDSLTMISTAPKEGEYKITTIDRFKENPSICPVTAVEDYINATKNLRHRESEALFVFLRKPYKDCSEDTLGRWTKEILQEAGIKITPHKIRSAATTQALQGGMPLEQIIEKANWTNCQTFKKHYWRPGGKEPVRMNVVNEGHPRIDELPSVTMFIQGCSNSLREFELPNPTPSQVHHRFKKVQGSKGKGGNLKTRGFRPETISNSRSEFEHP
jgi:hypothetical protein